jgi:hypothetical protein
MGEIEAELRAAFFIGDWVLFNDWFTVAEPEAAQFLHYLLCLRSSK